MADFGRPPCPPVALAAVVFAGWPSAANRILVAVFGRPPCPPVAKAGATAAEIDPNAAGPMIIHPWPAVIQPQLADPAGLVLTRAFAPPGAGPTLYPFAPGLHLGKRGRVLPLFDHLFYPDPVGF